MTQSPTRRRNRLILYIVLIPLMIFAGYKEYTVNGSTYIVWLTGALLLIAIFQVLYLSGVFGALQSDGSDGSDKTQD